ncbi:hypothetical protein AALP_AAs55026U000500 [Arabis alpina]|uniref:C3H1-type domain-containing protein n=1 Tax=Arabis alpina TaxID=50452 RepID=A0A087G3H4_ARAAL|nr:hypothetical protein AALP_AAs55026U000500 [Arabis alpina]
MSDSDMDIDDDDVQVQEQWRQEAAHTIAGESQLLNRPIQASNLHNDVKRSFKNVDKVQTLAEDKGNSQPNISGNTEKNTKLGDEKGITLSRFPAPGITPNSFSLVKESEQKRAALLCKFFAKGWCMKGNSCKFLHVKENLNHTSQQQVVYNMAGSSYIQSDEGRRTLDIKEGVRVSQISENGKTSLHTREGISFLNHPGSQRVFPSPNEMHFMSLYGNMGRESLNQKCGADVTENRSVVINNSNSVALRSSFVHEHGSSITSYGKSDMGSSGPAWTGSLFSSAPTNEGGSTLRPCENRNNIYGSGSLPMLQGISVSSGQDAEGYNTSNKEKVSSNDWEPSEPFQPSFTIPPYILPSSDALYDPFMDIENLEDKSLEAPLSSIGKQAWKNSQQEEDGDSASGSQARENDDKISSCSQIQHQETVARKSLEAYGGVEGVATSVVDQNDASTPSKEISSVVAAENRVVLKRSKPVGHDAWHKSDGSSYKKIVKSDEVDGEVRSDAGMKVMRQFRTAVVENIKEMLKPLWREGRLSKDVHNMIVKKAAEKVVSAAVQFHQVPTDTESVEQYLGLSATKIVKLVEGYAEKYGKH